MYVLTKLYYSSANIVNGGSLDTGYLFVRNFRNIRFNIYADQSLDAQLIFSNDGTNQTSEESVSTTAGVGRGDNFPNQDMYVKLTVTNNSGADTTVCRISLIGVS